MKKVKILLACLEKFGRRVLVKTANAEQSCSALLMPLRYKNKMYLDADVTDFGIHDKSRTLYIGPPEPNFSNDWQSTVITADDKKYTVTRADMIYLGERPAYIWAVLANVHEEE